MIHRVLTTVFVSVAAWLFSACCMMPKLPVPEPGNGTTVQVELIEAEADLRTFSVKIHMYIWEKDYDCLVQEVYLPGGSVLVEVFRLPHGQFLRCSYDHHTIKHDKDFQGIYNRKMFIYPATAEGVDWDDDFAHLPQNRDGSVKTLIGRDFNKSYQEDHETRGKVVTDKKEAGFWWSIEWQDGGVNVTIPEEHRYTAK